MQDAVIDAVVIGRNEGARLIACLRSLQSRVRRLVYVDSGSSDGSVVAARDLGAEVVALDMRLGFTAARARNAGLAVLDAPEFVQFVDGDCEVQPEWFAAALAGFAAHPRAVVVCGRRRERFPEASVYNRLADVEWDTPVGQALACGGDALMRFAAVQAVGGYDASLIAGEEPDLCLRLRRAGGEVWRIDAEMTLHDAALLRFAQWWQRMVRAGYAYAEGAARYGAAAERHWVVEVRRAVLWGVALPLGAVLAGLLHPLGWLLALAYPVQVLRLARRGGFAWGFFIVVGKFAEAQGVISYWGNRLRGRRRGLIEYK
ncbi:glycosyltransferase family 2 protein [Cypionkella sp.]|uniref:glycosyltransferase family 2 protein n=1 Tax=Cypionkella sp. TaxID=2811411 RepID=UPI002ABB4AF5|nr:glycosyltransferase [Cypionkella sp.]MDZ4392361.1 glycosyltransferase [Cypionkella sp.]